MAPKKVNSKADEAAKAALLAARKGKALALTQSTHQEATEDDVLRTCKDDTLRTCGPEGQSQPPPGFAPLEGADLTEDGEVLGISAEEQLQLRALRLKNRNLQRQKEILEAKRQRVSALAKVRQMIRDEEQKAQDLEREIALMQREGRLGLQHGPPLQQRAQLEDTREGHLGLQHGPPLQQRAQPEDLRFPQRDHTFPHAAPFQGVNYLDERSPLAPHLQVMPWPANFRAGTYPKYNGSTDPAQYIMSYQVAVASSGGDDATMAKSFIIALEGPALTWFTRLPLLSIDSWRSLRDKFLLNFQGYRPDTDALVELSLCKQLEKETLREYSTHSTSHSNACRYVGLGVLHALHVTFKRVSVRGADGDDPVGARHLELEVGVVGDGHELRVAWPPQYCVVGSSEPDHLEREGLPSEVGGCSEADGKVELSEGLDALPGDEPVERHIACPDRGQINTQEPKGLGVDDVEAAASVHEDLGEPDVADDGVDNERVFPRARHVVGVVGLVEGDGLVGPV
jgi:hypothetical protein